MDWPDLPPNPYLEIRSSEDIRVRGSRLGLDFVVAQYQNNQLAEEMVVQYPSLSLETVFGVLAYYLANKPLVEKYMACCKEREERVREAVQTTEGAPLTERIRALRNATRAA